MTHKIVLISNAAVTSGAKQVGVSGLYLCRVAGTFGGATVKLQIKNADDSTWLDLPNSSVTAPGLFEVRIPAGVDIRASVASGSPSALYATLNHLEV